MDDLEAVRSIAEILGNFEDKEVQERIIRWTLEKTGLELSGIRTKFDRNTESNDTQSRGSPGGGSDIKSFVAQKAPASDNQFAATVAYYYAFEAPPQDRKDSISPSDLTEACRMAGRARLGDPAKTLSNAKDMGYLDKIDRGTYKLNTVGENLVAMTLPGGGSDPSTRARKKPSARKANRSKKGGKGGRRK